ncbi:MAG: flagellar motor protein MotB [Halieaceae bacterium]
MSEFVLDDDEEAGGGAGWLATFADLMSLLMCFFVLLLSFSEMDVLKYKQIAGSMKDAFGVQNEVKVKDIPKGTSVIAQEFSSGRPDPTPVNKVQQQTADTTKMTLDTRSKPPGESEEKADKTSETKTEDPAAAEALMREILRRESAATAKKITDELRDEIAAGKIDIESGLSTVTIRIRERGSFPSGSADLNSEFLPVMVTLRGVLKDVKGAIAVEGHTDDIPISTTRFRSNWDLSADRALSVAHELFKDQDIGQDRFMVIGYADTRPLVDNSNWETRAKNRRVSIVIRRGLEDATTADLRELENSEPGLLEELDISEKQSFKDDTPTEDDLFEVQTQ